MSTEMGYPIADCVNPSWSVEVAVTGGRVRITAFGPDADGKPIGGKVFLGQAGTRTLMEQLQEAHAFNNWQPYPELYFD